MQLQWKPSSTFLRQRRQTRRRRLADHVRLLVYLLVFYLEARPNPFLGLPVCAKVLALPRNDAGLLGQVYTSRGRQRVDQDDHPLGVCAHRRRRQRRHTRRALTAEMAGGALLRLYRRRRRLAAFPLAQLHRRDARSLPFPKAFRRRALARLYADPASGLFLRYGFGRHVVNRAGAYL